MDHVIGMPVRYALYYVPPADSVVGRFGSSMLGYDSRAGRAVEPLPLPGVAQDEIGHATAEPARYGFHATLKAPFFLREGESIEALRAATDSFAARKTAIDLGVLEVAPLGAFLALQPRHPDGAVEALAEACVRELDGYRAPLSEAEWVRRVNGSLTKRQRALLERWGYPYVLDEFRFHMTLAGPLAAERREPWLTAVRTAFKPVQHESCAIDSIALMVQDGPKARFRVLHTATLQG